MNGIVMFLTAALAFGESAFEDSRMVPGTKVGHPEEKKHIKHVNYDTTRKKQTSKIITTNHLGSKMIQQPEQRRRGNKLQ